MSEDPGARRAQQAHLSRAVVELEAHVARAGWDGPPRLFALVPTAELLAREPSLAAALGLDPAAEVDAAALTPVEQEDLPQAASIEELLAQIAWPQDVAGAALTVERVMLPAEVEAELSEVPGSSGRPGDDEDTLRFVAEHPRRQEVRLAVGVLRDGMRDCALRMRAHDADTDVLSGPDLVPGLADALRATLD